MRSNLLWDRRSTSSNNFDLVLRTPDALDATLMLSLLHLIEKETHRGLSLSGRAGREFRRWAANPNTPLKSDAYVLLSNWFTTNSGDRRSMVASRCEDLWDFLFLCRPARRLSSPEANKNHTVVPTEFWNWWNNILNAQGDESQVLNTEMVSPMNVHPGEEKDGSDRRARISPPLTIAEAKDSLARTFGVTPDKIEIIIRG